MCLLGIIQRLKRLIYIIIVIISLGFTHQALAKNASSMVRPGVAHQDAERYFYTGVLAQVGYACLKDDHPGLVPYSGSTFSKAGVMLGLLVGRQWVQYVATELALEWLHSYGGTKIGLFSSELNETDLRFYTLGVGLDCMPMVPVSDSISLLGLFGIGYKHPNIKVKVKGKGKKIFDSIGWKVIPRIGVGVVLRGTHQYISLKLLAEFNNLFKDGNQSVFRPSLRFGTSVGLNFK